MRLGIVLTSFALLAVAPAAGRAQTTSPDTGRSVINTSGQARATVTPDRASITLFVEPQAMSVDEAATRQAAVERAVLDTLRRMGISSSSIQTVNSGVAPYRDRNMMMGNSSSFSGRTAIRVETSRLDLLSSITGAALAKGAASVSSPVFTASASDSIRRTLIPQAFRQARLEAEALAAAAGGRLGRLVSTGTSQTIDYTTRMESMVVANMMYDTGQRMTPGTIVTVVVNTSWTLLP